MTTPERATTSVRTVTYDPTGRLFAWGGSDGTVRIIDRRTGTTLAQVSGRRAGDIDSLAFSPSGRLLAFNGDDNVVAVWDVGERRLLPPLRGHTNEVAALVFGPNDEILFSGAKDGQVITWNVKSASPAIPPLKLPREIVRLAYSGDAQALAIG